MVIFSCGSKGDSPYSWEMQAKIWSGERSMTYFQMAHGANKHTKAKHDRADCKMKSTQVFTVLFLNFYVCSKFFIAENVVGVGEGSRGRSNQTNGPCIY